MPLSVLLQSACANLGLQWPGRRWLWLALPALAGLIGALAWPFDTAPRADWRPADAAIEPAVAAPPPRVFGELDLEPAPAFPAGANWRLLDADFSRRLVSVFKLMQDIHGYQMILLEGYRSPLRQQLLASQGPAVTRAAPYQSYHQFGRAADCAFMRDGSVVISEQNAWALRGYRLYGELAEAAGLEWGGRWAGKDFGHVQLRVSTHSNAPVALARGHRARR